MSVAGGRCNREGWIISIHTVCRDYFGSFIKPRTQIRHDQKLAQSGVPSNDHRNFSKRAPGNHRCHRSRGRQLLYAIASGFLSLLCCARLRVLTSAPPLSGFISKKSERQRLAYAQSMAQSEGCAPPKPKLELCRQSRKLRLRRRVSLRRLSYSGGAA